MLETIKNFPKQFAWEPEIRNQMSDVRYQKFLVVGMGGSHLAADLLGLHVWSDYGLPNVTADTLIICFSHSGNTEETIDGFNTAAKRGLPAVAISMGGKLLQQCKEAGLPYIQLPNEGLQPRLAVGHHTRALLKVMRLEKDFAEIGKLATVLKPENFEGGGGTLAKKIKGRTPLIYSSSKNSALAKNWKVHFNETSKSSAFYNVFPELNHNEMIGFDKEEAECYHFIFLKDIGDHPRIIKRMEVTKRLLEEKGFGVSIVELTGDSQWEKIFNSIVLADWTTYYLAQEYGVNPEKVPIIEDFKRLIG